MEKFRRHGLDGPGLLALDEDTLAVKYGFEEKAAADIMKKIRAQTELLVSSNFGYSYKYSTSFTPSYHEQVGRALGALRSEAKANSAAVGCCALPSPFT